MLVDHANSPRRFFMLLVASFAALGLLLAGLGIYGVISYSVTRQTCEIGIRMALGSSAGRVQREVLMGTLRLALIGIVLGCGASIFAVAPDRHPAVRDFHARTSPPMPAWRCCWWRLPRSPAICPRAAPRASARWWPCAPTRPSMRDHQIMDAPGLDLPDETWVPSSPCD